MGVSNRFRTQFAVLILGGLIAGAMACTAEGLPITELRTERVVETVIVEKQVAGETVRIVETVIVDRPVTRTEKVVETVIVEKQVAGETVRIVETVIVEKDVIVEKEKIVIATAAPAPTAAVAPKTAAPTATPGPVVAPVQAHGTLRVAPERVEPPIFRVFLSGRGFADALLTRLGVFEGFLRADYSAPPHFGAIGGEGIGTSWEIASDQSKITFGVRKGVEFHNGWGELTAEDVAFSFNDGIAEESKFTRHARQGEWMDHWVATDDRTVVLHLKYLHPLWAIQITNSGNTTTPMVSKRAFEALGSEAFNTTDMGTGPFTKDTWETQDRIVLGRFVDYFRRPAKVQRVEYIWMPEAATKIAALQTGEIDIATRLPVDLVKDAAESIGGYLQAIGAPGNASVTMSGNYWATTSRDTGETVFPRPGFKPDKDHPWIGDPFGDGNDMESARKVRLAMAMAIDRELLVEQINGGLGAPAYTYTNFRPDQAGIWQDEWMIPYDPARSRQLLSDAGYSDGFAMTLMQGSTELQMAEALGQMWQAIGIDVTIDTTAYDAVRPTVVNRSISNPMFGGCPCSLPDEAKGMLMRPTTGNGRGVELPDEISDLTYANLKEPDRQKRIQNNIELQNYLSHWMLAIPYVASSGALFAVGPNVAEWTPHQSQFPFFNSPETVVLK